MGDTVPLEYMFVDKRKATDFDATLTKMKELIAQRASLLFARRLGASGERAHPTDGGSRQSDECASAADALKS